MFVLPFNLKRSIPATFAVAFKAMSRLKKYDRWVVLELEPLSVKKIQAMPTKQDLKYLLVGVL